MVPNPLRSVTLAPLSQPLAVCRLAPEDTIPPWARPGDFLSISYTTSELSIVCPTADVPPGVQAVRDWRGLAVAGPLDFGEVGILASLTQPLADAGISIFAVSTYDTDYLLVREAQFEAACRVLTGAGHSIMA